METQESSTLLQTMACSENDAEYQLPRYETEVHLHRLQRKM